MNPRPDYRAGPGRDWPSLGEVAAQVEEQRRIANLAAGRVARAVRRLDRLAGHLTDLEARRDRALLRRECLHRTRNSIQDRLAGLDTDRDRPARDLKKKAARLARAMNALRRPDSDRVASYVEARLELRRLRRGQAPLGRQVARWRRAEKGCRTKLIRAEVFCTRLAVVSGAYQRTAGLAGEVLAAERREMARAAAELVRRARVAARMRRLYEVQSRALVALDRRPEPDRAPPLPGEAELDRLGAAAAEDFSRLRDREGLLGRIAADAEAGRRCLEQIGPLNRHIERAGRRLETALGLITPQARPDYLCSVVLPRLEIMDADLEALARPARSTDTRRERLAASLKAGPERLAVLGGPEPDADLRARVESLTRVVARGRSWEKSRRQWLLAWHRELIAFKARAVLPDLAPAFTRLHRRHRALRRAWRAYGQRLAAVAGAVPVLPRAGSGWVDPEADRVRERLGLARVRLADLDRSRDLLHRSAEPLRARQRTMLDPQTEIAKDERVRQLDALVDRLRLEVKRLTERPVAGPVPDPEQADWEAPRVRRMLLDTAPVIAFLAGELEKSRAEQRRLARESVQRTTRRDDIRAALIESRSRADEAETELARLRAEVEASQLASGFLTRVLALTAAAGEQTGQTVGQLHKALAARGEEVQVLRAQLARLSVLYLNLLKLGPPGRGELLAKRLTGFARRTLPHALGVILAAGSMLLVNPTNTSDAAYAPVHSAPPRLGLAPAGQTLTVQPPTRPVSVSLVHYFPLNARIDLSGLPPSQLAAGPRALIAGIDKRVDALARRSRLSRPAFLDTAHRTLDTSRPIKLMALDGLARRIRNFGTAHPHIFRDSLAHQFLAQAMTLMEKVPIETGRKTNWFRDRLYFDLVAAGMTRRQALVAVVTNARAARALRRTMPRRVVFVGQTRPLPAVEKMDLLTFVRRFSPFIADNCRRFLTARRQKVPANLVYYSRRLAFDIFCAAKTFQVPLTLMLNIPHQETYYANVLGDGRRSASPFQIFSPTKRLILNQMTRQAFRVPSPKVKLQNHLTLAAYLAAYHLRQLIDRQMVGRRQGRQVRWQCNLDNVVAAYNGSRKYIRGIRQKRRHLLKYLQTTGRPGPAGSAKGTAAGLRRSDRGRT